MYKVCYSKHDVGTSICCNIGSVVVPKNMNIVQLPKENLEFEFLVNGVKKGEEYAYDYYKGKHKVRIDYSKLQGILVSPFDNYIFMLYERVFVLAKVGSMYIPFYISSSGASGKIKGTWYPFFGMNQERWFIKGADVTADGNMFYSNEILDVQNILNSHMQLFQASLYEFIEEGTLFCDIKELNKIIKIVDVKNENYFTVISGYNPHSVNEKNALDWIRYIVNFCK